MHLSASHRPNCLPKQFPVGTTYVVEGRGGEHGDLRVFSRYVVLPGGQRINLANDFGRASARPASPRARRGRSSNQAHNGGKSASNRAKKITARAGTTRQRRR